MRYFYSQRGTLILGYPFSNINEERGQNKMMYLPIGTIQTATVLRKIDTGYVLNKETDEVLLHHNETEKELEVGEEVKIFLYQDKNNQIVATTALPTIVMDAFDWAKVVEVIPHLGVFVDIGIAKDILISVDDLPLFQDVWPAVDDLLYVTLGKDQEERLLALPATEGVIEYERSTAPDELLHKPLTARVYLTNREGTAVISEEGYRGFIHHTEREKEPRLGELVSGRVIDVKEDGTVNLSLLPLKQDRIPSDAEAILFHLENHGGVIPFSDKSDPEDIRGTFNISKSAFKRALGKLMKERKIKQEDGKTYLIDTK